jgi:hypothetical protein
MSRNGAGGVAAVGAGALAGQDVSLLPQPTTNASGIQWRRTLDMFVANALQDQARVASAVGLGVRIIPLCAGNASP